MKKTSLTQTMTESTSRTIKNIDALIRKGKGNQARAEIRIIAKTSISREDASQMAQLSFRAGSPHLGIQLLRKYVRPSPKKPYVATDREKLEYGGCLAILNAAHEALKLLKEINSKDYPMALMYQVFALVSQWKYQQTIPLIRQFLKHEGIDEYQVLVAKTNLIAALVFENQHQEADELIQDIIPVLLEKEHSFLYGHIMDLAAQNQIFQQNWIGVSRYLAEGEKALSEFGSLDSLFIEKWKAVLDLFSSKDKHKSIKKLDKIRRKATSLAHWETIRSCDMFEAAATNNDKLLSHLYFGTPFSEFRKKLLAFYPLDTRLPESYHWHPGLSWNYDSKPKMRELDIERCLLNTEASSQFAGQLVHKTLFVLCSDFYRSFSVPVLFEKIYEGEHYDPSASRKKIERAIARTRSWLSSVIPDLTIHCHGGEYSLLSKGFCRIQIVKEPSLRSEEDLILENIRRLWPNEAFTIKQLRKFLPKSDRSIQSLLNAAIDRNLLIKEGKARTTQYRLK